MDFSRRAVCEELMDAPDLDEKIYQRCLADLAKVNRVTFTHRATIRWLADATKDLLPGAHFSVLDVAYGQGDLLRAIGRWAARKSFVVHLSGIDLNPRSAAAARAATLDQKIAFHTGDVFDYAPVPSPDFIVTSQFTHHLTDSDIIRLLHWLDKHAVRGWHIADLHRHPFAYYGYPFLARLLRWHRIVRIDGTISIARSFTRADWLSLLREAGIDAEISWHFAFRYGISRLK